jgi:hypothetical protein
MKPAASGNLNRAIKIPWPKNALGGGESQMPSAAENPQRDGKLFGGYGELS